MKKEEVYVVVKTTEEVKRVREILQAAGEPIYSGSAVLKDKLDCSEGSRIYLANGSWQFAGSFAYIKRYNVSIDTLAVILNVSSKRSFETGSVRDSNVGKPRVADLLPYTRQRFGYHMLLGAEKYGEANFELGQPDKSSFESIHRHLASLEAGDKSEDHASAIIFGLQLVMQNQQRDGISIDEFYNKLKTK